MTRRYSLVEALLVEGAFDDRINDARARAQKLLELDPNTLSPRDESEYNRARPLLDFLNIVTGPEFPASGKNIGYLNWGIARLKECAPAEINTIAVEISDLIRAHIEAKGSQKISPNIDDYKTLGALRAALEEVETARYIGALGGEARKRGAESLDAALRMSDILYTDAGLGTDEDGRMNTGDSKLMLIAPRTKLASQVIGNPQTFGVNSLGGPVKWCTSATAFANQYCNYTVNSNVFLIYIVDLTKPSSDYNQKVALVYTPAGQRVGTGEESGAVEVSGRKFRFQTFNNQDTSGPGITASARASIPMFDELKALAEKYMESRGGIPIARSKTAAIAKAPVSDVGSLLKGFASEDLPISYGIEALVDVGPNARMAGVDPDELSYDYRGPKGPSIDFKNIFRTYLKKDHISRDAARRIAKVIIGMAASIGTYTTDETKDTFTSFLENIEDVSGLIEGLMVEGSSAGSPEEVKRVKMILEILETRGNLDSEATTDLKKALDRIDLLMAQAIGRTNYLYADYISDIAQTRYPAAIAGSFIQNAKEVLSNPKGIDASVLKKTIAMIDAITGSPGALGDRRIKAMFMPINILIMKESIKQIANFINKGSYKSATEINRALEKSGIADKAEVKGFLPAYQASASKADDLLSKFTKIIGKSSEPADEDEIIGIVQGPEMNKYLSALENTGVTERVANATLERAKREGDDALGEWAILAISSRPAQNGDPWMIKLIEETLPNLPEDHPAFLVWDAMGLTAGLFESRRRLPVAQTASKPALKETRVRTRYSLVEALLRNRD
jgi:hypothetical protein